MQSDEQQIRQLLSTWMDATRVGDVEQVLSPGGAAAMTRAGHTLTILQKVSGKWLLARDANLLAQVAGK